MAGWGVIYFGALAALLLLGWSVGEGFQNEAALAAWLLSVVAIAASAGPFFAMMSEISLFCPLCAVVHVINLVLVYVLWRLTGRSLAELGRSLIAGLKYLAGARPTDLELARWRVVGFLAVGLVAAVLYQWVYVEVAVHTRPSELGFDAKKTLALFESALKQEIPIGADDPQLGPADAPVELVVFSDFRCPGCLQFASTMAALAKLFDEELRIGFKHFPLDGACNPIVKSDLHPGACQAALAAEAARRQGRFWACYDAFFELVSEGGQPSLESIAKDIGLDVELFDKDRRSESANEKLRADIELGVALGVDGTPAVFLNGRRVYDTRLEPLQLLIAHDADHSHDNGHAHDANHVHANDSHGIDPLGASSDG